jgi:hypothetical protein
MKKRRYYLIGVLLIVLAVILIAYLLTSKLPFEFIPDNTNIIRTPSRALIVYVFPADFNSIITEAELELKSLGFAAAVRPSDDPNETRSFYKTHADGRTHEVEIYNKKLGAVGKVAVKGQWVSILIHEDLYSQLRKKMFIRSIKRLVSHFRSDNKQGTSGSNSKPLSHSN